MNFWTSNNYSRGLYKKCVRVTKMTLYYHFKKYQKLTVNCICSLLICFLTWRCFTNQLFLTCVCHIREIINIENSYGKNQHYHTVYNDEANNDLWTEMQKSKHETFVYFWIPHFLFSNCIQRKILFFSTELFKNKYSYIYFEKCMS